MNAANNVSLAQIIQRFKNQQLLVIENERGSSPAWSIEEKVAFVKAVLKGIPTREIYVTSFTTDTTTGAGHEIVKDGRQRILALVTYQAGELRAVGLPEGQWPIMPFREQAPETQRAFWNYTLAVRDMGPNWRRSNHLL